MHPSDRLVIDEGRTCAVHQPNLFPRLSTLAKLFAADCWVILDDVQFVRRDYQHRCRVGTPGVPESHQWLSLPVHRPQGRATLVNRVKIADTRTARRRLEGLLTQHYGRTRHWPGVRDALHQVTELIDHTNRLDEIAIASTQVLLNLVGWSGNTVRSSTFDVGRERSSRLAELSAAVRASTYICGTGGARYLDERSFREHGIRVVYRRDPAPPDNPAWGDARLLTSVAAFATLGADRLRTELQKASR